MAKIIPDEQKEEVLRLYFDEKKKPKEISEQYDISLPTIYKWTNEKKKDDLLAKVGKPSSEEMDLKVISDAIEEQNNRIMELEEENQTLRQHNAKMRALLENLLKSFLA